MRQINKSRLNYKIASILGRGVLGSKYCTRKWSKITNLIRVVVQINGKADLMFKLTLDTFQILITSSKQYISWRWSVPKPFLLFGILFWRCLLCITDDLSYRIEDCTKYYLHILTNKEMFSSYCLLVTCACILVIVFP